MPQSDQCISCRHYRGDLQCDAFPERIPQEILSGEHDHTKPFTGDHGIGFAPLKLPKRRPALRGLRGPAEPAPQLMAMTIPELERLHQLLVKGGFVDAARQVAEALERKRQRRP